MVGITFYCFRLISTNYYYDKKTPFKNFGFSINASEKWIEDNRKSFSANLMQKCIQNLVVLEAAICKNTKILCIFNIKNGCVSTMASSYHVAASFITSKFLKHNTENEELEKSCVLQKSPLTYIIIIMKIITIIVIIIKITINRNRWNRNCINTAVYLLSCQFILSKTLPPHSGDYKECFKATLWIILSFS